MRAVPWEPHALPSRVASRCSQVLQGGEGEHLGGEGRGEGIARDVPVGRGGAQHGMCNRRTATTFVNMADAKTV